MAEIKIENVSKTYSSKEGTVQALKNVSLTIRSIIDQLYTGM